MTTAMLRIAGFFMLLVLAIELTPLPANAQRLPPKQCLNCKNEVPGTSKVGDICPHCGVKWEFDFSGYSRRKFDPNKIKLPEFQPKKEKRAGTQVTTMPASVIVRVPEQATVEIEGRKMKSTGEERYYVTPSIVLKPSI
ncbi:MAG: hypothetical protein KatS3mg105_0372 [Gemmatales bacterium]|nr:MAG: hypothetical protein KatS3mg105_0372 [Gemmatales bacterium]